MIGTDTSGGFGPGPVSRVRKSYMCSYQAAVHIPSCMRGSCAEVSLFISIATAMGLSFKGK